MKSTIHVLWFLVATSDAIAGILVAIYFFRTKRRFGKYLAWMMVGISVEAVIASSSLLLLWAGEVEAVPAFAITRTIGRTIKAGLSWLFLAYLFYWINGDSQDDPTITRNP